MVLGNSSRGKSDLKRIHSLLSLSHTLFLLREICIGIASETALFPEKGWEMGLDRDGKRLKFMVKIAENNIKINEKHVYNQRFPKPLLEWKCLVQISFFFSCIGLWGVKRCRVWYVLNLMMVSVVYMLFRLAIDVDSLGFVFWTRGWLSCDFRYPTGNTLLTKKPYCSNVIPENMFLRRVLFLILSVFLSIEFKGSFY